MAKRSNKIKNEYQQYLKMSPEFVHLTGESLKQQIGGLDNAVEKITAQMINLSTEIEALGKSEKEEDKKALEAKKARKESLNKALENAKKERDEQKPKLEKQLNRVQGFEKNRAQIEIIRNLRQKIMYNEIHLSHEKLTNEIEIKSLQNQIKDIDNEPETKSVIAELDKMSKADVKNFDVNDIEKLDELEAKKADIDAKKKAIAVKISALNERNKELERRIEQMKSEMAKCDFAWKNLFANKTWDEIKSLQNQIKDIDNEPDTKSVIAELDKMSKADVKNFDVNDIEKLDELEAKKADIDAKKKAIAVKISALNERNKELERRIEQMKSEMAKCDFAWKNLFANKTWDEIEAKSMDGRFTKKEEKAKQEEPAKEEKASAAEKPTVEDVDKPVEPMWTDLQSEEEAKKEEAEQAAKENNEKALVKTSRWSKLWNAIKHPIQTIKAAREKAKSGEGKRIIKNGDAIKTDGEPEKTDAQSVDAFIAKLRQMSEKEAVKDAQNKDNKEQPDYSKYVARHARKVEAQKQRDDEGR